MTVCGYMVSRFSHPMPSNHAGLFPTPRLHTDIDFLIADLISRSSAASGLIRGFMTAFFLEGRKKP
jgi:hypothetical protein